MHDAEKLYRAGLLCPLVQPADLAAPPLPANHSGNGAFHLFLCAVGDGRRLDEVGGREVAQSPEAPNQGIPFGTPTLEGLFRAAVRLLADVVIGRGKREGKWQITQAVGGIPKPGIRGRFAGGLSPRGKPLQDVVAPFVRNGLEAMHAEFQICKLGAGCAFGRAPWQTEAVGG